MGESQVTGDVSEMMKEKEDAYGHADVIQNVIMEEFDLFTIGLVEARVYHYWYMILTKLCRLLFSPRHLNSWRDVIGYATLAIERMEEHAKDK